MALAGCGSSSSGGSSSSDSPPGNAVASTTPSNSVASTAPSNGVASKSAEEILKEATLAAHSASTVHVSGRLTNEALPVKLDLKLARGKGGTGEISLKEIGFNLILVDQTAYLSGDAEFYNHIGGTAAAQHFAGKWLKVSGVSGEFAAFAQLANKTKLLNLTLTSGGALTKGATATVNGQPAIAIKDAKGGIGTLYVATTGKPYPVEITRAASAFQGEGKITFEEWNQPVNIAAPASSIDLAELKAAGSH